MLLNLKNLKAQERGKGLSVKKGSAKKGLAASGLSAAQNQADPGLQQALAASMNPSSNVNPADYDPDLALILAASMNPSLNVNPADYDPDLASALAASLLTAAETAQNSAAQNSEDLQLQRDLADIARSEAADAQVEPDFEARAEQGEFVQEKSEPETITVKGKEYTIHQLQTIRQSKVTGRCDGDMSCFGQSVKNAAAIIDWQQTRNDSALAPLVRLPEARAKLEDINRLLDNTDFPLGSRTHAELKDENGFYHDVSVEEGSALFEQHQSRNPFLNYQIVMNRNFLDALSRQDFDIKFGLKMLQENSSRFFDYYQISSSTLGAINAWQNGSINILGINLQTEGHYIAIVFERNSYSGETNIWVSDSTFGIKRLHNKWSKDHLFVPLINFVENFDIKPWFEQLSSIRDAKQRAEEAEQGGGFSLFDSGSKASSLAAQAPNKLQSHIARFGGINNANEAQGGRTPLIAAVEANDYDLALDLYRAGADINGVATGEHAGKNALFFAANWGRLNLVKLLLRSTHSLDAALQAAQINLELTIERGNIPGAGSMQDYIEIIQLINAQKVINAEE
jgi:hypothetical protein